MSQRKDTCFSGSIDDLSVFDLMEILHFTRKSGVLLLRRGRDQAEIFFSRGNVVAASSTTIPQFISDHLIQAGAVDRATIQRALEAQARAELRRPIGSILIEMGAVDRHQLGAALSRLIGQIVRDAVAWDQGSVEFRLESTTEYRNLAASRDLWSMDVPIDTLGLIKDGLTLYNERNHRNEDMPEACESDDGDEVSRRLDQALESRTLPNHRGVMLYSADPDLRTAFRIQAQSKGWMTYIHSDAGEWASHLESCDPSDDVLSAAVFDLSRLESPASVAQAFEVAKSAFQSVLRLPMILVFDPENLEAQARAHAAGFDKILVRPRAGTPSWQAERDLMSAFLEVVDAGLESALAGRNKDKSDGPAKQSDGVTGSWILEFIRNRSSSSVSLSLLRFMAENAERSVLFLNRDRDLLAIGAFGATPNGETISSCLPHLTIPCDLQPIDRLVKGGGLFYGEPDNWPACSSLFQIIGRPANPHVLLLPVTILGRVALVAYCDNGLKEQSFEGSIGSLEAISRYAGLVLENSLLRKKVKERQLSR